MKALTITMIVLFLSGPSAQACSTVEVLNLQPSSQHVRIKILRGGSPAPDVKLEVSGIDGQPRYSLLSDRQGLAEVPTLAPGNYCMIATASLTVRAELCLAVSKQGKRTSSFFMDLADKPIWPPTLEERLETAEKTLAPERMQDFAGTVEDPTGAVVPRADVEVFPHGHRDQARAMKLKTDENGHFSAALSPGLYTAVFQSPGFQSQIVLFDLAQTADKRDLRVTLKVGMCT